MWLQMDNIGILLFPGYVAPDYVLLNNAKDPYLGDGELTCYGNPKYEKIVERSACGRDECPLKGLYDKVLDASRGE
jgi:hypothetical protein